MPKFRSLAILGPTASGKSSLAIKIAKKINGEIIGLDSRQSYRFFEIGTAQPSKKQLKEINHYMIGCFDPYKSINAGENAKLTKKYINKITSKGKIPIVCGGSGLYYRALTKGIFDQSSTNHKIRDRLDKQYQNNGPYELLKKLKKIDPEYSKLIHPNNKKRLVRALEVFEITGKPLSEHFKNQSNNKDYNFYSVLINWNEKFLLNRIKHRVKKMLQDGWLDEVKNLMLNFEIDKIVPLDSLGYRDIIKYHNEEISLQDLEDKIILKTKQFSKKQLKWFKSEDINFTINIDENIESNEIVNMIINKFQN